MVHPDTGEYNIKMIMPYGDYGKSAYTPYRNRLDYSYSSPYKYSTCTSIYQPKLSKVDSIYLLRPELRESYRKLPCRPTAPKLEEL